MAAHPKTLQSLLKLPVDRGMLKLRGSGLYYHGKIHTGADLFPVDTKVFTDPALNAVATNRVTNFPANSEPQADTGGAWAGYDQKLCGMAASPLPPGLRVLSGGSQPTTRREALVGTGSHEGKLLGGDGHHQALAPLGTPPLDHVDTVFGTHPSSEAVGPLTTNLARLIGSFAHGTYSLLRS
jgi:hypothetical protein